MRSITSITGFKKTSGFTLIELLIVIAIIAIFSGMGLYGYNNYLKRARDTTRKSDLTQYRTQLEAFANKNNGLYPAHSTSVNIGSGNLCASGELNLSGSACPTGTTGYLYSYISDSGATRYMLSVQLESTTNLFGLCSNGTSLEKSSLAFATDCP
jgi:prepilin-type N-terminal cleavage/methylation domain-containing protein